MAVAKRAVQPQWRGVKARRPAAGTVCGVLCPVVAGLVTVVSPVMRRQVRGIPHECGLYRLSGDFARGAHTLGCRGGYGPASAGGQGLGGVDGDLVAGPGRAC